MTNKELTAEEIHQRLIEGMYLEAATKPWSYSWKFMMAHQFLKAGRDIKFVKDMLGVTYAWMIRINLIRWQYGRMVPV